MIHPRFNKEILGHDAIWQDLVTTAESGKLPHALLITGSKGIGKASFAYAFAKHLLSRHQTQMDHSKMVENQAHPDLFVIEDTDPDDGSTKEIKVDRVRELLGFAKHGSVYDGYKVVIIDSIDSLNRFGSNSILKLLEEPNDNTVFLLICHHLSSALPTIRSRCRIVKFPQLDFASYTKLMSPADNAQLQKLYNLTKGSVSYSTQFIESENWETIEQLLNLSKLSKSDLGKIAKNLSNNFDLQLFAYVLEYICDQAFYLNSKNPEKTETIHKTKIWIHEQLTKIDVFNLEKFTGYLHILSILQSKVA